MRVPSLIETYEAFERRVEPRIASLLQDPEFHRAVGVLAEAQARVGEVVGVAGRRVLRALNLPTGTDVRRLRRQVGELDREVRTLQLRLVQAIEDRHDAK